MANDKTSSHISNVISRIQLAEAEREKEAYLKALLTLPISARVCVPVPLIKSEAVQSVQLRSKEVDFLVKSVRSFALKKHSFVNHENISICYCPNVLKGHSGSYTLSIVNPDTGDIKVVCTDSPVDSARIYIVNWPRSVPSAQNLFLNYECDGSDAGLNVQLGLFKILWDEKPSFKMMHVKDVHAMMFPVPETDGVYRNFTNQQLESFLRRLMLPGTHLKRSTSFRVNSKFLISNADTNAGGISTGGETSTDETLTRVRDGGTAQNPVLLGKAAEGTSSSDVKFVLPEF
nr:movement protein [Actinidia yellowing ringspot virus]